MLLQLESYVVECETRWMDLNILDDRTERDAAKCGFRFSPFFAIRLGILENERIIDSISAVFSSFLFLSEQHFFDNHRQVHVAQDRSEKGSWKPFFFALRPMAGCIQVIRQSTTDCFVSDSWEFRTRRFVSCRFVISTSLASISAWAAERTLRMSTTFSSLARLIPTSFRWLVFWWNLDGAQYNLITDGKRLAGGKLR